MGFAERRQLVEKRMGQMDAGRALSLARHRLNAAIESAIGRFAGGDCLDCGAGLSPYESVLGATADEVTIVDIEDRSGRVDVLADIQDMPQIADGAFNTVLCTQVLEHVPHPRRALGELARVLAAGGVLIASVPHLSAIHEAPNDFFRYTEFGLRSLAEEAGLEVVELTPTGGILSFLGHGLSVALMTTLGTLPGLFHAVRLINYGLLVRLAEPLDRWFGMAGRYPCDYVLVARKPVVT
jgi:SAM-dependent methyltransferase